MNFCAKVIVTTTAVLSAITNGSTVIGDDLSIHTMSTWKNNSFYAFRGIRFAEPPIGVLRYQDPIPFESSWNITNISQFVTSKSVNECPSPYATVQNEDCLFLNVYTRNVSATSPVIVFIHPGGFYIGSGIIDHFGPEYIMEEDIVLVTFNYRLATLGFASTTMSIPYISNAGLKDQALVLKWVNQNIRNFGGDPGCVTLMGSSAGAMSVALHLVSPLSRGLFHRAIIMSGGIVPQTSLPRGNNVDLLKRQGYIVGCSDEVWFDCLQSVNASMLAHSVYKLFEFGRDNPTYLWLPVIENEQAIAPFLTDDPLKKISDGQFNQVPILTGTTKDEVATSAYELLTDSKLRQEWQQNFTYSAPICLHYERGTERSFLVSSKLWKEYYDRSGCTFNETNILFSDAIINYPVYRTAILAQKFTKVFYYKFSYRGAHTNYIEQRDKHKSTEGLGSDYANIGKGIVEHCDDLQYLFTSKISWKNIDPTDKDSHMVMRMTNLIGNFAKNGYPRVNSMEAFQWPQFDAEEQHYVDISNELQIREKPMARYELWNSLFVH